jgi:hypothetical protein
MSRRLASFHITVLGWILLVLVPIAILLAVLGPHAMQVPAFIAAAVLALFVVGGTFSGMRGYPNTEAVSRAATEFRPRARSVPIEQETYDPQAWQRERERRERDGAGQTREPDGREQDPARAEGPSPFGR